MWTEFLLDSNSINAIYNTLPELKQVSIKQIELQDNAKSCCVRIDLNKYSENPPAKWKLNKFNTVQIVLRLVDISSVSIKGWDTLNLVDFSFEKFDNKISLKVEGVTEIEAEFSFLDLVSISAYQDSELIT